MNTRPLLHRTACGILMSVLAVVSAPALSQSNPAVPETRRATSLSLAPVVERGSPAVVNIYTRKVLRNRSPLGQIEGSAFWRLFRDSLLFGYGRDRIEKSLGSGVLVRPDGMVVTNHHVIQSAGGILVAMTDGTTYPASVILSDKKTDIAVLRIPLRGRRVPHIELGDSDKLRTGDVVVAIGNPFGLGQTITSGIVSALARSAIGISDFRFFVQTDAAINPGNSGGALISTDGKLVGINTAIFTQSGGSQGLGFAVPSNMVRTIIRSAVQNRPLVRPWIGVSGRPAPARLAFALGLTPSRTTMITNVFPDGPAAKAGLVPGDIVLSLNGFPITSFDGLRYRVATQSPGAPAQVRALRNGRLLEFEVMPVAPPTDPPPEKSWLPGISAFRGARVASLSPALAEELGLDSAISGVVVLDVRAGSSSARLGLQAGDIVRSIGSRKIRTVAELASLKLPLFSPWSLRVSRSGRDFLIRRRLGAGPFSLRRVDSSLNKVK